MWCIKGVSTSNLAVHIINMKTRIVTFKVGILRYSNECISYKGISGLVDSLLSLLALKEEVI